MTAKEIKQDIADLKLAIKSPATPEDKKTLFENKVKELEEKLKSMESKPEIKAEKKDDDDFYKAIKKKAEPKPEIKKPELEKKKSVPLKKSEIKDLEYDCDELIEKEKKRKAKAKERANQPKKSEATKIKDRLGEIADRVEDGAEDGKLTRAELIKLINECKALLKVLEAELSKMK